MYRTLRRQIYTLRVLAASRLQLRQLSEEMNSSKSEELAVAVRSVEEEDFVVLALHLRGHAHRLKRPKVETLGKALKRISLVASKPEGKGKRKWKKEEEEPPVKAHLYSSRSDLVPEDVPNAEAWADGNLLVIGSEQYRVELNPPAVLELRMPDCCMAGYPVVPLVEVEFTDPFSCIWVWRRYLGLPPGLPVMGYQAAPGTCNDHTTNIPIDLPDLQDSPVISRSSTYWPSQGDVGYQLVVECVPATKNGRRSTPVVVSSNTVIEGPVGSPIAKRHLFTPGHLSGRDQMRIITYNILADRYATSTFARTKLYPFCDPTALTMGYRECLIVQELLGYHADIVCLQEVDMKSYHHFIYPALREKGYEGSFCRKAGQIPEGEATFTNSSKFSVVSTECILLREYIQEDPSCSSLYRDLAAAPSLLQGILTKHTILLVTFVECVEKPDHYLCIANTHLYFHPLGNIIRLLQVEVALRAIHSLIEKFKQSALERGENSPEVAVLLAGDFNSCPCIAPYNYTTRGFIKKEDPEWMSYRSPELDPCDCVGGRDMVDLGEEEEFHEENIDPPISEGEEVKRKPLVMEGNHAEEDDESRVKSVSRNSETLVPNTLQESSTRKTESSGNNEDMVWPRRTRTVPSPDTFTGLDLNHRFHFINATGSSHPTNIAVGFQGVLDYVFIDSDRLEVERTIPFPPMEEVTQFVALPSVYFPSDHLASIVDVKWK